MILSEIKKELFLLAEEEYRDFHAKLIPTVDRNRILGVRVPKLRKFAKELHKSGETEDFVKNLPHKFYEEDNLHAFIICEIKDFKTCVQMVDAFLPYVDNWATCDSLRPKCFKNNKEELLLYINSWLDSEKTYVVRYAIEMLMTHFLENDFHVSQMERVAQIKSDEYYIKMMIAWYFATALAKQHDFAVEFLKSRKLDKWVHNKTIQKAMESNRISASDKAFLKTLRVK